MDINQKCKKKWRKCCKSSPFNFLIEKNKN